MIEDGRICDGLRDERLCRKVEYRVETLRCKHLAKARGIAYIELVKLRPFGHRMAMAR
jgi:hypothetical protein